MLSYIFTTPRRVLLNVIILLAMLATAVSHADPASAADWPSLTVGHAGPNVTTLQYLLRHRGYPLQGLGTFGPKTEASVQAFQRTVGLQGSGIVGPRTWSQLIVQLDVGARSNAVTALQVQLKKHGYGVLVDGYYGSATRAAVVDFKQQVGLSSSSLVGPQTWQALISRGVASSGGMQYATSSGHVYTGRRAEVLQHLRDRFSTRVTTYVGHSECPTCSADLWTPGASYGVDNTDLQSMNALAEYIRANAPALGIRYVIWNQHISSGGAWQPMSDRGTLTANHKDHVHITFADSFR